MNIKKSQLLEIIKAVVRETIKERKDKFAYAKVTPKHKNTAKPVKRGKLSEQQMQEVAPPGWGPDKKHAKLYNKIKAQYPNNDGAAYATMWKIHKKLEEAVGAMQEAGLTSEASHKVVSPNETDTAKEDKARKIQTDPKVNEASYKVVAPTAAEVQKDNKALTIQTEPEVNEASYKVVSPRQARVQKDNHALEVQSCPKVSENHKVQARSACTVQDLPNDPQNVRDPEVPNC